MPRAQAFDHMLGSCAPMQQVFALIEKVAATDLTVLILGETGTGKELVARSLHARSARAKGPFVAINCAALPATLIESELFGFERGSFTGAVAARTGHVERAEGGTLFLDEVAELPLGAQSKLLRVLQDHRVQRIGAKHDRKVDVRVLAATHQDLARLVQSGLFRQDLFHRLNQMQLQLPPLRDRDGDIELIATEVLRRLERELGRPLRLDDGARAALRQHAWDGNVRELENCLQRAAATAVGADIDAAQLQLSTSTATRRTLAEIVRSAEEAALRDCLRRHSGCVEAAAAELDISEHDLRALAAQCDVRLH